MRRNPQHDPEGSNVPGRTWSRRRFNPKKSALVGSMVKICQAPLRRTSGVAEAKFWHRGECNTHGQWAGCSGHRRAGGPRKRGSSLPWTGLSLLEAAQRPGVQRRTPVRTKRGRCSSASREGDVKKILSHPPAISASGGDVRKKDEWCLRSAEVRLRDPLEAQANADARGPRLRRSSRSAPR
jgi:hypothetical protein